MRWRDLRARWRPLLALGLALLCIATVMHDDWSSPLRGVVLVVPLGRGGEFDINLWGPSPDVRVVVWHQTAASNQRVIGFTVPAWPAWWTALALAVGLLVSDRRRVRWPVPWAARC